MGISSSTAVTYIYCSILLEDTLFQNLLQHELSFEILRSRQKKNVDQIWLLGKVKAKEKKESGSFSFLCLLTIVVSRE